MVSFFKKFFADSEKKRINQMEATQNENQPTQNNSESTHNALYRTPLRVEWQELVPTNQLSDGMHGHSTVLYHNKLYLYGGACYGYSK